MRTASGSCLLNRPGPDRLEVRAPLNRLPHPYPGRYEPSGRRGRTLQLRYSPGTPAELAKVIVRPTWLPGGPAQLCTSMR